MMFFFLTWLLCTLFLLVSELFTGSVVINNRVICIYIVNDSQICIRLNYILFTILLVAALFCTFVVYAWLQDVKTAKIAGLLVIGTFLA